MQVHAVPDSERAFDSTGRRLPWAFEFADSDQTKRRIPEEKGPFGKARKRGTSRSKTATPARKEDQAKLDNIRVIDDIFARSKAAEEKKESLRVRKTSGPSASLPISASAPNLIDGPGLVGSFQAGASTGTTVKEPTEVILYGYGNDVQWAAVDYYEKVSGGIIYEDYDRQPPSAKYNLTLSAQKASSYRSLSKVSLRKINEYVGGEHWIKVTFDSPEAAERACHYSPHVVQGYTVFAERYRGTGPNADRALRASAGAQTSQTASPNTLSSTTMPFGNTSQSSHTLSSATATGSMPASMPQRQQSEPVLRGAFPVDDPEPTITTNPFRQEPSSSAAAGTTSSLQPPGARPSATQKSSLRVRGARPVVLLPQEKAFLPAAPRWQQTLGSWPIIGWVVGSGHGMIGDQVPRKEDGSFDSKSASLYWRVWYAVDSCFGTDFCGVKDAEYDD
ncbi:uncharacterized protein BDR25DRAFT_294367 [Lindgomyces ingoldianus]|uniref:Uncharacterized protein n=1 Tax=Lindgomyces ingoldianus TaxID=673940 RepID=A0ACB6QFT3_9PLEO|nr:uncharacterized protein BDR25DRAFT_294367 [Lindgomyces ingoldianus]KAF2465838.1 hypothetical protein BDR25DRAFT_294367 [Lindgomyces ingoldianus]